MLPTTFRLPPLLQACGELLVRRVVIPRHMFASIFVSLTSIVGSRFFAGTLARFRGLAAQWLVGSGWSGSGTASYLAKIRVGKMASRPADVTHGSAASPVCGHLTESWSTATTSS